MSEQSSSLGWLLRSPFHQQLQLIYNVGHVGVVWVFSHRCVRCFAFISSVFIFPLPHPLKIPTVLLEFESNMHMHVYMHICMHIYIHIYEGRGGGVCVYGLCCQTVKEFMKPCIFSHATARHPLVSLFSWKLTIYSSSLFSISELFSILWHLSDLLNIDHWLLLLFMMAWTWLKPSELHMS